MSGTGRGDEKGGERGETLKGERRLKLGKKWTVSGKLEKKVSEKTGGTGVKETTKF